MVSTFSHQSHYHSASLSGVTNHTKGFKEDDASIVEDSILDQSAIDSGLELSPPMASSRRESFAVGPPLFSPKAEDWQSVEMQSLPSGSTFVEHANSNPFMQSQAGVFGSQNPGWQLNHGSGAGTPLQQQFDGLPGDFDTNASIFSRPMQGPNPFAHTGNIFAGLASDGQSMPTSPQKDWMALNQPMDKTMPGSPAIRSHNEMRRGDGIRKKNARFDIPAERNLSNIDQLISQSNDEQEIKELKQQKRLLRNRQAALDSRQRKKQHTERLEDEKKQYTVVISDLEEEVTNLKSKLDQALREKQSYADYAETVTLEKDEMIGAHTLETGELRKKLGILTEHVQRLENGTIPVNMADAGAFPSTYSDLEDMNMAGAWDNTNFLGGYHMEHDIKTTAPIVPAKKTDGTQTSDGDKTASQGGLLFMLFLVGAFVMSSRSTPVIPQVSEDVRAASATLLDNVLKDAGVNAQPSNVPAMAPQPSGSAWTQTNSGDSFGSVSHHQVAESSSMLAEYGDSLTQPTEQQTNEQVFSLSPGQYNGISHHDFLSGPQSSAAKSMSQGRRNLAEAMAAIHTNTKQSGAAEVYTRSLLWDQIPSEVVRNFAKMVAECNNAQNEQQCNEAIS